MDITGLYWTSLETKMVEAAGIEPASERLLTERLRACPAIWVSPGLAPAGGLSSGLVRLNFASASFGPEDTAASPLHGVPAPSRGRGGAARSLAVKQREPAQCRLVCFATLFTGPSGVPGAQHSCHVLPSNPDRPHKVCACPEAAIMTAGAGRISYRHSGRNN